MHRPGFGFGLLCCAAASAQLQFTRIADEKTPVPGAPSGYSYYLFSSDNVQAPTLRNGQVTFEGYSRAGGPEFRQGLYRTDGSALVRLADSTMSAPGGGPIFKWFGSFTVSGSDVAFAAYHVDNGPSWVYSWRDGVLAAEITAETPIPGGPGNFTGTARPWIAGDSIAFVGRTPGSSSIYVKTGSEFRTIARPGDAVPTGGLFEDFYNSIITMHDGRVVFQGQSSIDNSDAGLYAGSGGPISLVANRTTLMPGTSVPFRFLGPPVMDGPRVVFHGWAAGNVQHGIYGEGSPLVTLVSSLSFGPVGGEYVAADGGNVAFEFDSTQGHKLFARYNGSLIRVIGEGDFLDGRVVDFTRMGRQALEGNQLVFEVHFSDSTWGIYVATLFPVCYSDCNGDGALNLADFGCFQTRFALGDPYADCNGDAALNLGDFGCFQTKFALGCP